MRGRRGPRDAGDAMAERLRRESGLDVRVRETRGGADGTLMTSIVTDALSDVARARIAGVVIVTDGQAADPPAAPRDLADLGPAHVLIVGDPARGDRRLELVSAPTFGIVGENTRIVARVVDTRGGDPVRVRVSIDGAPVSDLSVRANRNFNVDVNLPKRGRNMVILDAEAGAHEITLANNRGREAGCPLQWCIGVLRGGGMSVASGLFADR